MKNNTINTLTSDKAIILQNVSKHYRLANTPFQKVCELLFNDTKNSREFVALNELSLEIGRGTCVGIIGPNGAGKSTLLKLLGGIIKPTTGTITMKGTLGSIIELGSGFHPDFTGTENIMLNATLQNIPKSEVPKLLEDIRAFTSLGKYMDLPVKAYSSGMFVRLAFALAISTKPDILLVDEALAVGDAIFAHKCLQRIAELKKQNVTIVFVSHDTSVVTQICDRCLFFDHGSLIADGPSKEIVNVYLQHIAEELTNQNVVAHSDKLSVNFHQIGASEVKSSRTETRFGTFDSIITDIFLKDINGQDKSKFLSGETLCFEMLVRFDKDIENPIFGVMIKNRFGIEIFGTNTRLQDINSGQWHAGQVARIGFKIPAYLGGGTYSAAFAVHAHNGTYYDYRIDALIFEIFQSHKVGGQLNLPIDLVITEGKVSEITQVNMTDLIYADAPSSINLSSIDATKYLADEWFEILDEKQNSGRWMGRKGTAFLSCDQNATTLSIKLKTLYPSVTDKHMKFHILFNDTISSAESVISSQVWNTYSISIPETLVIKRSILKITLVCEAWRPSDFGSEDNRELSVIVNRIAIENSEND